MSLGQRVRQLRIEQSKSQADVVRLMFRLGLSIDQSYLSQIERDRIRLPSRPVLRALAAALETTEADLSAAAGYNTDPAAPDIPPDLLALCQRAKRLPPRYRRYVMQLVDTTLKWLETEAREELIAESPPGSTAQLSISPTPPDVTHPLAPKSPEALLSKE